MVQEAPTEEIIGNPPGLEWEWVILADAAQVVQGKLYVMGGGWAQVTVSTLPLTHNFAVAVAVRVPWHLTNRAASVTVEVVDEDTKEAATIEGGFEVGRPPGMKPGQPQIAQFAASLSVNFRRLGEYRVKATVNGDELIHNSPFRVVPSPDLERRLREQSPPAE